MTPSQTAELQARCLRLEGALKKITEGKTDCNQFAYSPTCYSVATKALSNPSESYEILRGMVEALEVYSKRSNWCNAGWEGHPDDCFRGPEIEPREPWGIAEKALQKSKEMFNL